MLALVLVIINVATTIPWFHPPTMNFVTRGYVKKRVYVFYGIAQISLALIGTKTRESPNNLMVLGTLTLITSVMSMVICSDVDALAIWIGLVIFTICTFGMTIFSHEIDINTSVVHVMIRMRVCRPGNRTSGF
ncbi:unnamed protein product [Caenorhabditis angaria]|uniref:Uncharacterized protein n=1 Tax=Caenorhabditis angaria TaxID=860376 RepID=A0A9P1IT29_9PELO|nr:unnamed protein product [Caenorhabditis angaria]